MPRRKTKKRKKTTVYVSPSEKTTLRRAKTIFRREGYKVNLVKIKGR